MAHIRQPRPHSGLEFQGENLETFEVCKEGTILSSQRGKRLLAVGEQLLAWNPILLRSSIHALALAPAK